LNVERRKRETFININLLTTDGGFRISVHHLKRRISNQVFTGNTGAKSPRKVVSLSMREDLISMVDGMIDGTTIRNRSHAIEYIIMKFFRISELKVLILAGGRGGPGDTLKCMFYIAGKPILEYILDFLKNFGLKEIIISLGFKAHQVKEYFGDGYDFGVTIDYIEEYTPSGTAGALLEAKDYLDSKFIVIYGDNLFRVDLNDMLRFHDNKKALLTLGVTSVSEPSRYGVVDIKGDKITNIHEKPATVSSYIINAGIFIAEPKIFEHIKKGARSLEREVFPRLSSQGLVYSYHIDKWYDLDRPEDIARAEQDLSLNKEI
jgi:NDP-sugar pyrophosphorylase family protein